MAENILRIMEFVAKQAMEDVISNAKEQEIMEVLAQRVVWAFDNIPTSLRALRPERVYREVCEEAFSENLCALDD